MNCNFSLSKYRNSTITFDFGVTTIVAEFMYLVSHEYVNS